MAPAGGWSARLIGFSLPSRGAVDDTYRELTAHGYRGVQVPYDAFWGARYAIVADPDGNEVGTHEPARRRQAVVPSVAVTGRRTAGA